MLGCRRIHLDTATVLERQVRTGTGQAHWERRCEKITYTAWLLSPWSKACVSLQLSRTWTLGNSNEINWGAKLANSSKGTKDLTQPYETVGGKMWWWWGE